MSKIVIDPGHGGHDPGAVGRYSKEKDNVLKVAKRLKTLLEGYGHTVRLTRSTDVFLTLSGRAVLANNWDADYFVSLHDNAATSNVTGFETFIHNGPVSSKTVGFQSAVHNAIIKSIGIKDRGKKRANFAVVRETGMPAVLIEYGFISNANDEKILIDEVEKLAQLTANGIVDYVGGIKPSTPNPTPPKKEEVKVANVITRYSDVVKSHSAHEALERISDLGIITGYTDGTFRPNEPLTRAHMAIVVDRLVNRFEKQD